MDAFTQGTIGAVLGGASTWLFVGLVVTRRRRPERNLAALVGAVVGLLAFLPGHYSGASAVLATLLGGSLVSVAACDVLERRVPNRLTYPSFVVALVMAWVWPDRPVSAALVGAVVAVSLVVLVLVLGAVAERATSKSPWGTGDLKLLILLGAILGWPLMLWALFLGIFAGGFGAATALARRKRALAYGPYLVAGGLVALLLPDSSP